jgi:Uma2 family endonuclease
VRLHIAGRDVFYYPDLMVTCDPRDTHRLFKSYPKVIIEVLSESTENTDRREKFWNYIQLESMEEYVLVAQDKVEVTIFRRATDWNPETLEDCQQELELRSLNLKLPVSAIYERVPLTG